jgi:hypothetical protein
MSLNFKIPFPQAMKMCPSVATALFESKALKAHIKNQEAKSKTANNTIDGLNGIIRAIGSLGKMLSRR